MKDTADLSGPAIPATQAVPAPAPDTVAPARSETAGEAPPSASRRAFLLGLGGATILAWSATSGWITAPRAHAEPGETPLEEPGQPLELGPDERAIPRIRGTLELSDVEGFGKDFGGFVHTRPWAVLHPADAADVAAILTFATENNIPVAVNGQSGPTGHFESHSHYGQALTEGGIQINARALGGIHSITPTRAVVGAGVTWAELVEAALEIGATVPSLPDYVRLSIGGTISVGGVGGNVQREGLMSDIVTSLEVVTAPGRVYTASRRSNASLFDGVRGGAGQLGVITRVELRLVPALANARIRRFVYDTPAAFLNDQRAAAEAQIFDHQAGFMEPLEGGGWRYVSELGTYFDTEEDPAVERHLRRLRDRRSEREDQQLPYRDWVYRIDQLVPELIAGGYWEQRKPWLSVLIPGNKMNKFLARATKEIGPRDLGAGFCLVTGLNPRAIKTPMFRVPTGPRGDVFFFDLLAFPHPDETEVDAMLERNRRLYDYAVRLGGKRYIIGAIPRMTLKDWRVHYGWVGYKTFYALKHFSDPKRILARGQGIF